MRKNTISSFIQKTFDILQDQQYQSILTWSPDGNSFLILDQHILCSQVLPKYFKHSNFSSFIRQLNMYNFHKKKNIQNKMEFYHRLFRKDKRQLLIGIKRKPSEAQIQFGEELIRKMNRQSSKSASSDNSVSDENINQHYQKQKKDIMDIQNHKIVQSCDKNQVFDTPPTFYYPMWMGMNVPFFQINQQNVQNVPFDYFGRKILTNIIIKTPPHNFSSQ